MARWYLKAALQGVLSHVPGGRRGNEFLQAHVTRSLGFSDSFFRRKAGQAARHAAAYRELARVPRDDFTALELGTGWYPVVPVGLFLCGAGRVYTVDVRSGLTLERVRRVLTAYAAGAAQGTLGELLPGHDATRVETLRAALAGPTATAEGLLSRVGVQVVVGDVLRVGFEPGSIDLIVSNNTLEHVPAGVLEAMFGEFHRLLAADGLMSHSIDLSDHYSHFDHGISPYNFLRYSDRRWRWFNGDLGYQNRWRVSDYRDLHARIGFEIAEETSSAGRPQLIDTVPLAGRFRGYARDDLVPTSAWFAARPVAD
jgi:SAM-dependent methyltransferase